MSKTPGGRINDLLKYRLTGQKMTERRVRTYGLYIVLVNRLFPPLPVFYSQVCVKHGRGSNEAEVVIIAILDGLTV